MTTPVPTTGVRLNADIAGTFGGSAAGVATKMSSYYKGGANVNSNQATSGTDGTAIPASGNPIRMGEFRGLSKTAAAVLALTPSTSTVSGLGGSSTTGKAVTVTTGSVTMTPSNGTSPYTYAWTLVSGTSASLSGSTSNTTTFSRGMTTPSTSVGSTTQTGVFKCTVTDATGATASANVTVNTTCQNTT